MRERMILVTGASGFIGRHVVSAVSSAGARPVPLLRDGSSERGLEAFRGDIRRADLRDKNALVRAMDGVYGVIHLAGLTRAKSQAEFDDVNGEGVARLVEACRQAAHPPERFLYVSSLAAAGPSRAERPRREEDPESPVSGYGRSKLLGEKRLREVAGDLPFVIVRPPIVYGPWDRDLFEVFKLARRGMVPVAGSADRRYSVIFGQDLAETVVRLLSLDAAKGRAFFVGESHAYTYRELVAAIGAAVGREDARVIQIPTFVARGLAAGGSLVGAVRERPPILTLGKLPEILAPGWAASVDAVEAVIPGHAKTSLRDGAASTAAWYTAEGWW